MNQIKTYRIVCLSEAMSPITHMGDTAGNEALLKREAVAVDGAVRWVPVLSGNALRHRMVREPGALYLARQLGLMGEMSLDLANFLLTGGSLTESSISDDHRRVGEMQELFPLLRLLGGSLANQIGGGSLNVLRGVLVCEENRRQLAAILPEGYMLPDRSLRSAEEYVSAYGYTRGDVERHKDAAALVGADTLAESKPGSNLMIYGGQSVTTGALFVHGFVAQNVAPLEVGALLHSLREWHAGGATVGGQARIGHGVLDTAFLGTETADFFGTGVGADACVRQYVEHVEATKDRARGWLTDAFPLAEGRRREKEPAGQGEL